MHRGPMSGSIALRSPVIKRKKKGSDLAQPALTPFSCDPSCPSNKLKYSTYPSLSISSLGMNRSDAELMQYLSPVGLGPSSNTCPRCESPKRLRTSVRVMNSWRSDSNCFPYLFPNHAAQRVFQ